jgi:hypothetical protein
MSKLRTVILAVLVSAAAWQSADACGCAPTTRSDREEAALESAQSSMIFEGEVLSVGRLSSANLSMPIPETASGSFSNLGDSQITFRVLRKYKGPTQETVTIYSSDASKWCLVKTTVGERWFVYGFEGKDGKLYMGACSRSNWLEAAAADVRYSRGEAATDQDLMLPDERTRVESDPMLLDHGATLSGAVGRSDRQSVSDETELTLWELDKAGQRTGNRTATQQVNRDGTFTVRYVPAGSYLLTVEDRNWALNSRFIRNYGRVNLKENSTLTDLVITLEPDPLGPITVRVEPQEALLRNMWVMMTDSEFGPSNTRLFMVRETADLSPNGVAHFDRMPYANYDVYVSVYGVPYSFNKSPIPGWCQDETRVKLEGPPAVVTVHLHKCPEN